jgi:hypothetical protein
MPINWRRPQSLLPGVGLTFRRNVTVVLPNRGDLARSPHGREINKPILEKYYSNANGELFNAFLNKRRKDAWIRNRDRKNGVSRIKETRPPIVLYHAISAISSGILIEVPGNLQASDTDEIVLRPRQLEA